MADYQDDVDEETESYTESEEEVDSESEQASQAQDSNAVSSHLLCSLSCFAFLRTYYTIAVRISTTQHAI